MLFFIFIVILIVGIVFYKLYDYRKFPYWLRNMFLTIGMIGSIIGALTVGASIIVMSVAYINAEANLKSLEVERSSLVYQYNNRFYDNDNDIGKKELMSEIQDFNQRLVKNKQLQHDIWVGIYYPNIYDGLKLIDIEE